MPARFVIFWTFAVLALIALVFAQYIVLHFAVQFVPFTATVIEERNYVSKGSKCEVTLKTSGGKAAIFYRGICIKRYKAGEMVAFNARVLRITGFIDVDPESVKILTRPND